MTKNVSFGAVLQVDPAGGSSYTTVAQVGDIQGPTITRGDVDTTTHDSADNGYREYKPGRPDGGELTFPIQIDFGDSTHVGGSGTGLLGDLEADGCTLATWKLILPRCDAGTAAWTWSGYVKGFNPAAPVEGTITGELTVKVSGKPTLTTS